MCKVGFHSPSSSPMVLTTVAVSGRSIIVRTRGPVCHALKLPAGFVLLGGTGYHRFGGCQELYGELFGWSAVDNPIPGGGVYTMFQIDGNEVAAAYAARPSCRRIGEFIFR